MKVDKPFLPQLFKGIAVFTPGGDLIYTIDPNKQDYWHLHLCIGLQKILGLPEPPHFLVPGYTATIDRWIDPRTKQVRTSAEVSWPIRHHQALLNAVFGTRDLSWQVAHWQEGCCNPIVLETYLNQFPQLWQDHDLIVRFERPDLLSYPTFWQGKVSLSQPLKIPTSKPTDRPNSTSLVFNNGEVDGTSQLHPLNFTSLDKDSRDVKVESSINGESATSQSSSDHCFSKESQVEVQLSGKVETLVLQEDNSLPAKVALPDQQHVADTLTVPQEEIGDGSEIIETNNQLLQARGYVLRLFVSGNSEATEHTLKSLHQFLEDSLRHPYTLKVIDVFKHPEQAEKNHVLATPTLLRVWPSPPRRIVGDLNDVEKILRIIAASDD
ncbi:MAG: circadian clock KaiB family protein [Coleofasciculaceae cyanobacterium]